MKILLSGFQVRVCLRREVVTLDVKQVLARAAAEAKLLRFASVRPSSHPNGPMLPTHPKSPSLVMMPTRRRQPISPYLRRFINFRSIVYRHINMQYCWDNTVAYTAKSGKILRKCGAHGFDTSGYRVITSYESSPCCGFATGLHYSHNFNTGCYKIIRSCQSYCMCGCVESIHRCETSTRVSLSFEAFTMCQHNCKPVKG